MRWMRFNGYSGWSSCGQCLECRQAKAREWGLRNSFEADTTTEGCFITLTYDEEHNPIVLIKKHLQDFKKRLRRYVEGGKALNGRKIRTFDCGEYGDKNYRPHFHMLIHGFDFPDKYEIKKSDKGYPIYNSEKLEKIWGKGLVTVQDMTMNAAAYCARYSAKPTKFLPAHLQEHPEFNTFSKSLGTAEMLKKIDTYLETDEIYYDGKKFRIPQCVLNKRFEAVIEARRLRRSGVDIPVTEDEKRYVALKEARIRKSEQHMDACIRKHKGNFVKYLDERRYVKENADKRLQKKL